MVLGVTVAGVKLSVMEGGATIVRLMEIVWSSKVAAAPPLPAEPPAVNVEVAIALDDRFTGGG